MSISLDGLARGPGASCRPGSTERGADAVLAEARRAPRSIASTLAGDHFGPRLVGMLVERLQPLPLIDRDDGLVGADLALRWRASPCEAIVVPPAGSVRMPSVAPSRSIASKISASVAVAAEPPRERTASITRAPSPGAPIASECAAVSRRLRLDLAAAVEDRGRDRAAAARPGRC